MVAMDNVKTKDEAREIAQDFVKSWKGVRDPTVDLV